MKSINLSTFLFLICFASCVEQNRESRVVLYFEKMGWNYPLHIGNENLRFANDFSEDDSIKYDTLQLIKLRDSFSKQAVGYFKKELSIDTSVGYIVEKPIIYNDVGDSLVYSIGVKKFKSNNKQTVMPCEGCQAIESNTIFVSGNRAVFKINTNSILEFKNWMD